MRLPLALLVLTPLLLAPACGGSSSNGVPSVSGSFGQKPKISTHGHPTAKLQDKVLQQGSGAVVAKGDLLVADYLGEIWGGKVFDNSYDRGQPAAFPIGVGKVIPGWDKTLVGVKAGSRVLLVLPPADGYGSQGNPQAGIKGTDTLIFVVDVISSYGKNAGGEATAAKQPAPKGAPVVTGALGQRPTVKVPKGLKQPTKLTTIVLARGTGAAVKRGLVVVQFEVVDWQNKTVGSTWQSGQPDGVSVGTQQGPFDLLLGLPVGSRVLLEVPSQPAQGQSQATPSVAAVVDIVAQPQPANTAK